MTLISARSAARRKMSMLLLASASAAFQPAALPAQPMSRAVAPTMGYEKELGATGPLGYWDPIGLVRAARPRAAPHASASVATRGARADWVRAPAAQGKRASPEQFARYRAVEIKHGRIAMAACTGATPASSQTIPRPPAPGRRASLSARPPGSTQRVRSR